MMAESLLLILYGICVIGSGFTVGAWTSLALREADRRQWKNLLHDQFFVIAVSFLADAVAVGGIAALHLWEMVTVNAGRASTTSTTVLLVGLLAFARAGFVWGRRVDAASPAWRWFCVSTIIWSIAVILWALL
jgi:hypothetical protein